MFNVTRVSPAFLVLAAAACALPAAQVPPNASYVRLSPEQSCPDHVVTQQAANDIPSGFRATVGESSPTRLARIAFSEGDANAGATADVQPYFDKQRDGVIERRWKFSGQTIPQLNCFYANTQVVLSRALLEPVQECRAALNGRVKIAGEPSILSLSCK